jgi:hypothetical protein
MSDESLRIQSCHERSLAGFNHRPQSDWHGIVPQDSLFAALGNDGGKND